MLIGGKLVPLASASTGSLSGMRRHRHDQQLRLAAYLSEHPVLETIYRFRQRLCYLLLKKHRPRTTGPARPSMPLLRVKRQAFITKWS